MIRLLFGLSLAATLSGCVQIYDYGNGNTHSVTITISIMATVPVSAIPGAP